MRKDDKKPKMTERQVQYIFFLLYLSLIVNNYIIHSIYLFLTILIYIDNFRFLESMKKDIEKLL